MSQLLCRIAKISSFGKQRLCFSKFRFISTAAETPTPTAPAPYLLFNTTNHRRGPNDERIVDIHLLDPTKYEEVKIPDQTLPDELCCSVRIGSSRGWVGFRKYSDDLIRITNIYNPSASVSSHKVISLPPLKDVQSFSLSASPNQQEDCVVAATSTCSSLWLCRLGDSEWTRVNGVPYFAKDVTYSERDRRFYVLVSRQEGYDGPIDLIDTSSSDFPQVSLYRRFPLSEFPMYRGVSSSETSQYLVESPSSGDSFIVFWHKDKEDIKSSRKTNSFVVFRQDHEQKIRYFTEDIGDLCIFLGKNEAFCVSSTEYPGLSPNSVYFASFDTGFGYYDLSSDTIYIDTDPHFLYSNNMWLAPLE